ERGAQRSSVAQIAVDDVNLSPRMHERIDSHQRIEARSAHEPPYFVTEVDEVLGEIRAVLSGDPGDERPFARHVRCRLVRRSLYLRRSFQAIERADRSERHDCPREDARLAAGASSQ